MQIEVVITPPQGISQRYILLKRVGRPARVQVPPGSKIEVAFDGIKQTGDQALGKQKLQLKKMSNSLLISTADDQAQLELAGFYAPGEGANAPVLMGTNWRFTADEQVVFTPVGVTIGYPALAPVSEAIPAVLFTEEEQGGYGAWLAVAAVVGLAAGGGGGGGGSDGGSNTTPPTAPLLTSTNVKGRTLTMTYDQSLDTLHPPTTDQFTVRINGVAYRPVAVNLSGAVVTLTLPIAAATTDSAVSIDYTAPASGSTNANGIQDADGHQASTLNSQTVTNVSGPAFQSASVQGTSLALTYDTNLDASNLPNASQFSVYLGAGQSAITPQSISVVGSTLYLSLPQAATAGSNVYVEYNAPTPNDGVNNAIQDAAGHDAASLVSTLVANRTADTTAPTLLSTAVNQQLLTLTYDSVLDSAHPPAASLFTVTVNNTPVSVSDVRINNAVVALTLSTSVAASDSVSIRYTDPNASNNDVNVIQDTAGNDAASLVSAVSVSNTTADVTAPVLQTTSVSGTTLTLTYDSTLDSAHPPKSDQFFVYIGNSTVPTPVTSVNVSGAALTLTLGSAVTPGDTVRLYYKDPTSGNDLYAVQDTSGNDATALAGTAVTNITADTTAPVVRNALIVNQTLTLSYDSILDAAHPPQISQFSVYFNNNLSTPIALSGVSIQDDKVILTLATAAQPSDTVKVSYSDFNSNLNDVNAIQDTAGNDALSLNLYSVSNVTAPIFQTASLNGAVLTLTYDSPIDSTRLPDLAQFSAYINGTAYTPIGISANANTLTLNLPIKAAASDSRLTLSYTDPRAGVDDVYAIQNAQGNDAVTLLATTAVTNLTGPMLRRAAVYGSTLALSYDTTLDAARPPVLSQFEIFLNLATTPISPTALSISGDTVYLSLGTAVAPSDGVQVRYTAPSTPSTQAIQDLAGNDASNITANASNITGDTTAPTLVSAAVNANTLTLTYDSLLDSGHPPLASSFTVLVGGVATPVNSVVRVSDAVLVLSLNTPVTASSGPVTVSYSDPTAGNDISAAQDLVGNDAASLAAPFSVTNNTADITAPVLLSAAVNASRLVLTYDSPLDIAHPPKPDMFIAYIKSASATIESPYNPIAVEVTGNCVALTLPVAVSASDRVRLYYKDPSASDDAYATQDTAGNDAASLVGITVTNDSADTTAPVLLSAAINGSVLNLTYDSPLDSAHPPAASLFTVRVDGVPATLSSSVRIDNAVLSLDLTTAVAANAVVTLTYADPSFNNDVYAVQDKAGNDAISLLSTAPFAVTNNSADTTPPALLSASVNGTTLSLGYDSPLDAAHLPDLAQFTVRINGTAYTPMAISLSGSNVTLTLPVPASATDSMITLDYSDPSSGNDVYTLQDTAGNDASALSTRIVTNTTAPVFQSAAVYGTTVALSYDTKLDAVRLPLLSQFQVFLNQSATGITPTALSISGDTVYLSLPASPAITSSDSLQVRYTAPSSPSTQAIQDVAGNDASSITANASNLTSDTTAPTLVSAAVNATMLTLNYDSALDGDHLPLPSSFAVLVGGVASPVSSVMRVSDAVLMLTLNTPVTASSGAVTLSYSDPTTGNDVAAVQDLAGNDAASLSTPLAVTNTSADTIAPVLLSAAVNATQLVLTYDSSLDSGHAPDLSQFFVYINESTTPVRPTNLRVSDTTLVLTLPSAVQASDTVRIYYKDPTANDDAYATQDTAGNDAASLAGTAVTNFSADTTAPVLLSAAINGPLLNLTYDSPLDSAHPPAASLFTVRVDGVPVPLSSTVRINNAVLSLSLSSPTAVTAGSVVTLTYADPSVNNDVYAVQDLAGNDAVSQPSTAPFAVTNTSADTTPPVLMSAVVDGTTLSLTYNSPLDAAHLPDVSKFSVAATSFDDKVAPLSASVDAAVLTLTLPTPVAPSDTVTVSYTDPTTGNDVYATQDVAGNDAATFTNQATINNTAPVFQSAQVYGTHLSLTYDKPLDSSHLPLLSSLDVRVNGVAVSLSAASALSISANTVNLTLPNSVGPQDRVTVGYTDPSSRNDSAAIQDSLGNDVATLSPTTVATYGVVLTLAHDTGRSATDGITKDGTVAVAGLLDGAWRYSIDAGQNWSSGSGTGFVVPGVYNTLSSYSAAGGSDGPKSVWVQSFTANGLDSVVSAPLNFTLDTTRPPLPVIDISPVTSTATTANQLDNVTTDTSPVLYGNGEPGSLISFRSSTASDNLNASKTPIWVGADGLWSFTSDTLTPNKLVSFSTNSTDIAGNLISPGGWQVLVDQSVVLFPENGVLSNTSGNYLDFAIASSSPFGNDSGEFKNDHITRTNSNQRFNIYSTNDLRSLVIDFENILNGLKYTENYSSSNLIPDYKKSINTGKVTYTINQNIGEVFADGTYNAVITATDGVGNQVIKTLPNAMTIDTVGPENLVWTSPFFDDGKIDAQERTGRVIPITVHYLEDLRSYRTTFKIRSNFKSGTNNISTTDPENIVWDIINHTLSFDAPISIIYNSSNNFKIGDVITSFTLVNSSGFLDFADNSTNLSSSDMNLVIVA